MADQMNVLLVDARSSRRKSFAGLITGRGWTVHEAVGASRALAELMARHFDLVVAGPSIRGMDTASFCRAVRTAQGSEPVVVTLLPDEGIAASMIEAGADDCLSPCPEPGQASAALDVAAARVARRNRDIGAQRRSDEALRASEGRFRSLVQNSFDIVTISDSDGTLRYVSPSVERIMGYTPEDWAGRAILSFVHGDDMAAATAGFANAVNFPGVRKPLELRVRHRDGSWRVLETVAYNLLDDPAVGGIVHNSRDVTERWRAQEALAESERRFQALADVSPVGIFRAGPDGLCTYVNRRWCEMSGLTVEESLGRGWLGAIHAEDAERVAASWQTAMHNLEDPFRLEFRLARSDGGTAWAFLQAIAERAPDGSVSGFVGAVTDVTERRRSEQALLQAQKFESLGVLAGGIAHDFNNLLVSILGNAGLALMELSPRSAARETIHEIEVAGQRAADLARQMLAYSGKGRLVIQKIDVNELVDEMTHLLRVSIVKGATLRYDFGQGLPAIEGDATQIRQVIMNLVVNASDAIGDRKGVIRVSTGLVHANPAYLTEPYLDPELQEGEYVYVEVEDTGEGMDADTLSKIFDPFFTTKFAGRGLGLAAVLGIVRGHRGAIRVSSTPGKGTTFRLLLPASAVPVEESPAAADRGDWKGSGTILLVDDETAVRTVTARACKKFGFDVLTAADAQAGVDLFRQHAGEVVCVLLGITTGRLNGEEVLRQIRAISPGARVILLSAFDRDEAAIRFAGEGIAGFVQKPYELSVLRHELRRVLEN